VLDAEAGTADACGVTWSNTKRSVLVPLDADEPNRDALGVAASFVADPRHVTVLYVLPELPAHATLAFERNLDAAAHRDEIAKAIDKLLATEGHTGFRVWVRQGPAADIIVQTAEHEGTELIVMPSHGRKGLNRWLLGSVTERVVRLAPCPVLVLRSWSPDGPTPTGPVAGS
jgi:nucleotide-binding universal stress UspA family protein